MLLQLGDGKYLPNPRSVHSITISRLNYRVDLTKLADSEHVPECLVYFEHDYRWQREGDRRRVTQIRYGLDGSGGPSNYVNL